MTITKEHILRLLEEVCDPEIPVLSILDLGIVRDVVLSNPIEIIITPTYSGCPAMDAIAIDIKLRLAEAGIKNTTISYVLNPAWTTDWMSERGKEKLLAYGIAPPVGLASRVNNLLFEEQTHIVCPLCKSNNTELISEFGSTSCKSLYKCNDCKEPFDHFKCH